MPVAYATLEEEQFSPEDEETIARILKEEQEALDAELAKLARDIEAKFTTDAAQRQRKENEWYWAERLQLGSMWRYWSRWSDNGQDNDPFKNNPSDNDKPEFNIVKPKIKIGKAQLEMLQFGAGTDKNFEIKAKKPPDTRALLNNQSPVFFADGMTPMQNPQTGQPMTVGELAAQQSAKDDECARKMDQEIWSQLSSANYGEKMRTGFSDLLWYGTAIYKGPYNCNKSKKVRYKTKTSSGETLWVSAYTEEPAPDFERVNPWLFYPDSRVINIDDAEHATVVHVYNPTQLRRLSMQEGYRKDKIAKLLSVAPVSDSYPQFRARAIQYDNSKYLDGKYVVLEWHGTVGMDTLGRLGIEPPYENPLDMYKAEIWVCQGEVIYASLEMLEADLSLPFAVNTWEPDPASIFGFGAILLRDAQRVVNVTYQMVLDNAGLSAGPMAVINKEMIKSANGKPEITPFQLWYFTENGTGATADQAIQFINVPNNSEYLMRVLDMAREFGNEESIIPLIAGGLGDPQVGDTGATGMAMVMQASTSVLSSKAREWDDNITKPVVGWFYEWNMQYSPKEDIKGDYDIDVQTSTAYLNKIIGQRDIERLCVEAAQNPEVAKIIRMDEAYRARLAGMNIPFDTIVRTKEEIEVINQQQAEAAANNPDPASIKAQADMVNAQARMGAVENAAQRLEYDKEQGMVLAQIEHDKNTANYETRNNEAMARAMDAAAKKDIAVLQLAAKDKQAAQALMVDLQIAEDEKQERQFVAGVTAQQAARKLDIEEQNAESKKEELKIKRETGSGI
jgi:hypothetical protein